MQDRQQSPVQSIDWIMSVYSRLPNLKAAPSRSRSLLLHGKREMIPSLTSAINAVLQQRTSVRRAAEQYGIPKSTLYDHVSGKAQDRRPGPTKYLTDDEEETLVCFIEKRASIGYPKKPQEVNLPSYQRHCDVIHHVIPSAYKIFGWTANQIKDPMVGKV